MTSAERIERFLVGPLSEAGIIERRGGGGLIWPIGGVKCRLLLSSYPKTASFGRLRARGIRIRLDSEIPRSPETPPLQFSDVFLALHHRGCRGAAPHLNFIIPSRRPKKV